MNRFAAESNRINGGHNHFSTLLQLDTADTGIGDEILRFIRTV